MITMDYYFHDNISENQEKNNGNHMISSLLQSNLTDVCQNNNNIKCHQKNNITKREENYFRKYHKYCNFCELMESYI